MLHSFLLCALCRNDCYSWIYFFLCKMLQYHLFLSTRSDRGPITHYSRNLYFWTLILLKCFYAYTLSQDKQDEEWDRRALRSAVFSASACNNVIWLTLYRPEPKNYRKDLFRPYWLTCGRCSYYKSYADYYMQSFS